MSRVYELYLRDILKAIGRIEQFIVNTDEEAFRGNEEKSDSVMFNLMIIGEAVKTIPDEVRNKMPNVRWRDIGRLRDKIVHHYFAIDYAVIWEIVTVHLPPLREAIEKMLADFPPEGDANP
jgi:uncharacterized protein with HEPN domain